MKTVSIKSHDQLNGVGLCVIDGSQISDLRFNTGFMEERRVCKNADLKTRSDEGHGAIENQTSPGQNKSWKRIDPLFVIKLCIERVYEAKTKPNISDWIKRELV